MALVLETGVGVVGANAYVNPTYVLAYLTNRNRETENSWNTATSIVTEAACIAATDFVDKRFGSRLKGQRGDPITYANGAMTFTDQPADTETVTIGSITYTFVTSLISANDVLIGANVDESVANLIAAVNLEDGGSGIVYGTNTVTNEDAVAIKAITDIVAIGAEDEGFIGNAVATTETITNASFASTTLKGGNATGVHQSLEFPRLYLYDRSGNQIIGMPEALLQATAEYAVRAISSTLLSDPTMDDYGGTIRERQEKVGPIEERIRYNDGSQGSALITPYPAADRLMSDLLLGSGGTGGVYR